MSPCMWPVRFIGQPVAAACLPARRWWRRTESNCRPPACKAGALPAELRPHFYRFAALWAIPPSRDEPSKLNSLCRHPHGLPESAALSAALHNPRLLTNTCSVRLGCWNNSLDCHSCLHRKEVIQPHLPIRLPCYDFTPVANPTFGSALLAVMLLTSGITGSHGVTGGVYKARERIHRSMLICDY